MALQHLLTFKQLKKYFIYDDPVIGLYDKLKSNQSLDNFDFLISLLMINSRMDYHQFFE
jgi:hypothetical protein